jgi:hypothetical protein
MTEEKINRIVSKVNEKFEDFFETSMFDITEAIGDVEMIVFNYPAYYDSEEYQDSLQEEFDFIYSTIVEYLRNELNFKGTIFIDDSPIWGS